MHARLPPSLSHGMPRAASRPLSALPDSFVNRPSRAPASTVPRPRVLSSSVTRLHQYYDPIRHPKGPVPCLTTPPLASAATPATPRGLPVLHTIPLRTCRRHYPGGTVGCACRSPSPTAAAFPETQAGRLPHCPFRGLLSVHCTLRPMRSLSPLRTLLHRKLRPIRYLHGRSDCYRLERLLPGGTCTHWDRAPSHGALRNAG